MPVPLIRTPEFIEKVSALYLDGLTGYQIAEKLNVSAPVIYKAIKQSGVKAKKRRGPNVNSGGYLRQFMPEHGNADNAGYVALHILAASKALGRPLKKGEVVHHINGNKKDNRNCNLLICDRAYHSWLHQEMARRYQQEHFGKI